MWQGKKSPKAPVLESDWVNSDELREPSTDMNGFEFVSESSRLAEIVDTISSGAQVAVDIESNGFFRYRERICLVQLASGHSTFLVDPLSIDDVQPLGNLFSDRSVEKVFHAADNDLRSLDRDWGFRVDNLFDTSIAAALAGEERLGLQALVEGHTGVKLSKSKRLQRSDWTKRPLSPEALMYAANDVRYLLEIRGALAARLEQLSRLAWAKEEFERLEKVRHTPVDRSEAFMSMKGTNGLDSRGLAVLRSLCQVREREAQRLDRPVFKVLPDFALIALASNPAADFASVKGLGWFGRPPGSRRLKSAIRQGLNSEPVVLPKRTRNGDARNRAELAREDARLRKLKSWRRKLGRELELDPSLLWPRVSLERLARYPSSVPLELDSPEVRGWQRSEFSESLRKVVGNLG